MFVVFKCLKVCYLILFNDIIYFQMLFWCYLTHLHLIVGFLSLFVFKYVHKKKFPVIKPGSLGGHSISGLHPVIEQVGRVSYKNCRTGKW